MRRASCCAIPRWLVCLVFVSGLACIALRQGSGQTFTWGDNLDGLWSDSGRWFPVAPPGGPNGAGVDVVLPDIFGLGFPNNDDVNNLGILFGPLYWDTISRTVTLDTAGVSVDSILIEEQPEPALPFPVVAPGHRNVLTLDQDVSVSTAITLRGTRALLELNGRTVTGDVVVEAPVFRDGVYWHRNRIGRNVSLDDGLNSDLPGSPGNAFPVLPGPLTSHTPLVFRENTPALDPEPVSDGGTSGIIDGNLDSSGIVWLNGASELRGSVLNHSAFGYFRYDGGGGNIVRFLDTLTNQDQRAIMDINGQGRYESSVTNSNLGTMYMRSRGDLRTTWTNQSGGQYLFQPTVPGGNPLDPDDPGNVFRLNREAVNQGFAFASDAYPPVGPPPPFRSAPPPPGLMGPPPSVIYPFLTTADFDGDVVHRDTGNPIEVLDFLNQQAAVMTMRGNVRLGLVNRHHLGDPPSMVDQELDRITTLKNLTGGYYTYEPRIPAAQSMDITGEIINDGEFDLPVIPDDVGDPNFVHLHSIMNLFGDTRVRGRFLPTRDPSSVLLTNTNGAILNYSAHIDIGYDQLVNFSEIDVPHGNLDNTGGTINGFDDGNLVFRGGDQVNNGVINLSDMAHFRNGRLGTSTFINNGTLASTVYSGPTPAGYVPSAMGSPTMHAGILTNNGTIRTDATTTLNLDSAAVNNFGVVDLNGGTLLPFQGLLNYNTTTFNGGTLGGPFMLNLPGGLINGIGGTINSPLLVNSTGATMTLGNGLPNSLQINSPTFTQAGVVNLAAGFNLVTNSTGFVNSGTINLMGLSGNLSSPGATITNLGTINSNGLIGFFNAFTAAPTGQFVNVSGASLNVGPLGTSIGGLATPLNFGQINVGPGLSGLAIVAGLPGAIFTNDGAINLLAALNDLGTGKGLLNRGRITGVGPVDFGVGILNDTLGQIVALDPSFSFTPLILNGAPGNFAPVGNVGTIVVSDGTALVIPNTNFTNEGLLQMQAAGFAVGTRFNDAAQGRVFTNEIGGLTVVNGPNNVMEFSAPGISIVNRGILAAGTATLPTALAINPALGRTVVNDGGTFDIENALVTIGITCVTPFFNNAGDVVIEGSSAVRTGILTSTGASVIVGSTSFLDTADFLNLSSSYVVGGASAAIHRGVLLNVPVAAGQPVPTVDTFAAGTSITATAIVDGGVILVDAGATVTANAALLPCFALPAGVAPGDIINAALPAPVGGEIIVDGGTPVGGEIIVDGGTLTGVTFTNPVADSLLDISRGGSATFTGSIPTNAGTIRADGGSSIRTNAINSSGVVSLQGGSTLNTNQGGAFSPFVNTGVITLAGGSSATVSTLTNVFTGATNGDLVLEGGSTFTATSDISNDGGILVFSGSTLGTGVFTMTGGTVDVSDAGSSWLILGPVTQTNGSVRIQNGARGVTTNYNLTTGSLSLSRPGSGGNPTLDVNGVFTNTGGAVSLLNGATLRIRGNANNASSISLQQASTLTAQAVTNGGAIAVESGSTFRTDQDGTFRTLTNTGSVVVKDANSRLLTGQVDNGANITVALGAVVNTNDNDFNNQGGSLTLQGNNATLTTRDLTNQSANVSAVDGVINARNVTNLTDHAVISLNLSRLNSTGKLDNSGTIDIIDSTATMGVDLHQNRASGTIQVNTRGSLMLNMLENAGKMHIATGGVVNLATLDNAATGVVTVNDMTSMLTAGNVTTAGEVHIGDGGLFNVGGGGNFEMAAGAFTSVDAGGSKLMVAGNIIMNGVVGNRAVIKINNGGSVMAANLMAPPQPGPGGFNNAGNAVRVDPATLTILGDANFNEQDIFEVDGGSFFTLGDDFDNAMEVPTNWTVNGKVTLNGGGVDVQMFEVSGGDFGNTTSGMFPTLSDLFDDAYVDNYAIGDRALQGMGTLHITQDSEIEFVDDHFNAIASLAGTDDFGTQMPGEVITSTGAIDGGAAIYVNRLVLDPMSTLSLDLFHVYYREVSFDGGLTFQEGDFSDVLDWQSSGITFVPGSDGVTRYPIPFVPEPAGWTMLIVAALGLARTSRNVLGAVRSTA